jgi:DNA-binding FadR family transcriptional regulator
MPGDRLPSEASLSKELNVSRTWSGRRSALSPALRIIDLAVGKRATVASLDHVAMGLMIEHGVSYRPDQHSADLRCASDYRDADRLAGRDPASEAEAQDRRAGRRMREAARGAGAALGARPRLPPHAGPCLPEPCLRADRRGLPGSHAADLARWLAEPHDRRRAGADAGDATRRSRALWLPGDPPRAAEAMGRHFDESVRALVDAGVA